MVCGSNSCGRRDCNQGEEGGEGEHVRGQGEDDTPEGWTFLNFDSFARTDLSFWQKVKVTFSQKVDFDASLLVMKFYCQLLIRYHVTRAEAETCYGCLRFGIKIQKEVCLLRRSGKLQDRHWIC